MKGATPAPPTKFLDAGNEAFIVLRLKQQDVYLCTFNVAFELMKRWTDIKLLIGPMFILSERVPPPFNAK